MSIAGPCMCQLQPNKAGPDVSDNTNWSRGHYRGGRAARGDGSRAYVRRARPRWLFRLCLECAAGRRSDRASASCRRDRNASIPGVYAVCIPSLGPTPSRANAQRTTDRDCDSFSPSSPSPVFFAAGHHPRGASRRASQTTVDHGGASSRQAQPSTGIHFDICPAHQNVRQCPPRARRPPNCKFHRRV